jgi:prepilin-type processing-associated H-X9-DG protein
LVELLVVIGIIGVLIGILLPVMSKARESSKRTACAAQLRDIGNLFRIYLNTYKNRLPKANTLPSHQPPLNSFPSIYETIDKSFVKQPPGQAQGTSHVWRCPSDGITKSDVAGVPTNFDTYFDREGGSFTYDPFFDAVLAQDFDSLGAVNQVIEKAIQFFHERRHLGPERLVMFHDYEAFHGKPNTDGAMNFLFADFHVGDLK